MATSFALQFVLERETKGAIRYQEVDENNNPLDFGEFVVGNIYIRKDKLDGKYPARLKVTIIRE